MATPCGIPSFRATPPRRLAAAPPRSLPSMRAAALPPMPPLNPKDPFLAKLASVAAASPEPLTVGPTNPPFLDLFDTPILMATPAQVERSVSYNEHRPRKPPPDLPSLLLHGRIVCIGMPLVPAVMELVIAELMYLQWTDPKQPIYIYINSTGTTRDDGETVITNRDALVKLMSKHTGNPLETVSKVMWRPFNMDAIKAKEFGVIDKILWRGQEKIMADALSLEEWDKKSGIKVVDGI